MLPSPEIKVEILPELAEIDAVGMPEALFRKLNLAVDVADPPMIKSNLVLIGVIASPIT